MLIISALLLETQLATATSYVRIGISQGDTNLLLTLQDIPFTPDRLKEMMERVADIDNNQIILVIVDSRTPAEYLLSVISLLKETGLINVCIVPQHGRGTQDVLSLQVLPKTNEFIQVEPVDTDEIHGLLEEIELIDNSGEQGGPGYPPQGVGSPDP